MGKSIVIITGASGGSSLVFYWLLNKSIVSAERVVIQALKDAKRGKDMSVCSWYVKYLHLLAKIFPQKIVMKMWLQGIKKYF
jgi:short-subunit dehydrogenase